MTVKDDEAALWAAVTAGEWARDAGARLGIHPKRVRRLCEKWARQGRYEWGAVVDLGWPVQRPFEREIRAAADELGITAAELIARCRMDVGPVITLQSLTPGGDLDVRVEWPAMIRYVPPKGGQPAPPGRVDPQNNIP